MQSEPSSSSPKRAVSEDPSQDNARAAQSQGLSSLSINDAAADIDAYMADQGEDASAKPSSPVATPTLEEKLRSVESLVQSPMRVDETWYVVSSAWYRRWRKAVSRQVDKDGEVDENDLGPVDNSDIVVAGGYDINQELGLDDYVFVPEQVWTWFATWCVSTLCSKWRHSSLPGMAQLGMRCHAKSSHEVSKQRLRLNSILHDSWFTSSRTNPSLATPSLPV